MNYAVVENGIVTNLIWLHPMTAFQNAVPCGDVPVQIGDTYSDGKFYRDGAEVRTTADEMDDMREALEILGVTG